MLAGVLALAPWSWFLVRDLDPHLDAVALAWPVLAAAGIVPLARGALRRRRLTRVLPTCSWLLASLVVVVAPWQPVERAEPIRAIRVVAANAHGQHADVAELLDALSRHEPDVVIVSEINTRLDAALRRRYQHRARSRPVAPSVRRDVALYTDLPIEATPLPEPLRDQHGVRVQVEAPGGTVVLYGMHLDRPGIGSGEVGFRTHRRIVGRLLDAIEQESSPVIVAGDLNVGDRTSGYRLLTDVLDDAMRADWVGPTFVDGVARLVLVRIDHLFMPDGWCSAKSRIFTLPGSDHRGVAADVGPCPARD